MVGEQQEGERLACEAIAGETASDVLSRAAKELAEQFGEDGEAMKAAFQAHLPEIKAAILAGLEDFYANKKDADRDVGAVEDGQETGVAVERVETPEAAEKQILDIWDNVDLPVVERVVKLQQAGWEVVPTIADDRPEHNVYLAKHGALQEGESDRWFVLPSYEKDANVAEHNYLDGSVFKMQDKDGNPVKTEREMYPLYGRDAQGKARQPFITEIKRFPSFDFTAEGDEDLFLKATNREAGMRKNSANLDVAVGFHDLFWGKLPYDGDGDSPSAERGIMVIGPEMRS
ncbi:MAG: hypothetical protein ABII72_01385 [Parcubacteria group bacterium]